MFVSEIKLYEIFKVKFGEKEAEAIVEGIKHEVKEELASQKDILATKQDIARLELKISEKHNDLLKWMIIMWVTQLGAIITIIKVLH